MPSIGPMELIVVLVIALVVLGPKRLPGLGKQLGTGMREFKDGIAGVGGKDDDDEEDRRALAPAPQAEASAPVVDAQAPPVPAEKPASKSNA